MVQPVVPCVMYSGTLVVVEYYRITEYSYTSCGGYWRTPVLQYNCMIGFVVYYSS